MSIFSFCAIIKIVMTMKKDELELIFKNNPKLDQYINEYLNVEYKYESKRCLCNRSLFISKILSQSKYQKLKERRNSRIFTQI